MLILKYVPPSLYLENEERKFREVVDMKKNIALFNSDLDWELVGVDFD